MPYPNLNSCIHFFYEITLFLLTQVANCNFHTSVLAENLPRSRFKDVLPYEENRVRLSNADKDNKTGFINASHISVSVGQEQVWKRRLTQR